MGLSKSSTKGKVHSNTSLPQETSEVKWRSEFAQLCPTLCNPVDCSPPGSSVHEISQARIVEWVAISFPRGSSQPRDQTLVSCTAGRYLGENKYCWINWVMKSIVLTQVTLSMHMETLSDFLFVLIIFPFLILFPQILQIFQTFVPISSRVMGNRKTFINHFEFLP